MPGQPITVGGLFDGVGLLAYGLHRAGLQHAWLCEVDEWRRCILARRWPGIPVIPDVRLVGDDTVSRVDIIAGGFPCKGASTAGKRTGFDHPETVLWREMRRAIGELRPRYVLIENVANLLTMARTPGEPPGSAWGEVLADLATFGFDVRWDCLPAAAFGAPHLRDRVYAIACHPGGRGWGATEHDVRTWQPDAAWERAGTPANADGPRGSLVGLGARNGLGRARRGDESEADDQASAEPSSERRDTASRLDSERGLGQAVGAGHHRVAEVAADADDKRCGERAKRDGESFARQQGPFGHDAGGRGVSVEWGEYGPAVRRWEAVHGPAPEPLVRRVDDGAAGRVERSRLRALGDGVQVQAGELAGRWIVNHAAQMEARAAA